MRQGSRAGGAASALQLRDGAFAAEPGEAELKILRGNIVAEDSDKLFWVSRADVQGGVGAVQGFSAKSELLEEGRRCVKVVAYAADYSYRYMAALLGSEGCSPDLLAMVLRPRERRAGTYAPPALGGDWKLNGPQRQAVQSLKHALEVIHGPPGTGKSTTIVAILQARIPPGRTACVTCVTNQAVAAVCEKLQGTARILPFLVLGNATTVRRVSAQFVLEAQVEADPAVVACRAREVALSEQLRSVLSSEQETPVAWRLKAELDRARAASSAAAVEVEARLVAATRVFVCTIASLHRITALKERLEDKFPGLPHTVVLDEAGATPESYIPQIMQTGAENLVLLGDHKQLPPLVVTMDLEDVQRKAVNRSLMERAVGCWPQEQIHVLTQQYRMPPTLCALVSTLFYENVLETASERAGVKCHQPELLWLDVKHPEQAVGTSKVNVGEAAALASFVRSSQEALRVITFYSLQRDLLVNLLGPQSAEDVVSVDAAQGSEADHVVLSTVRSNSTGDMGFTVDPRRVCVAISRAKRSLTIVGDRSTMRGRLWQQIAVHFLRHGTIRPMDVDVASLQEAEAHAANMRFVGLQPCRFFARGACTNSECQFSHNADVRAPLVPLPAASRKPCVFYAKGCCNKGGECPFTHDLAPGDQKVAEQLRAKVEPCHFHAQGLCEKGRKCTFSHDFRPGDPAVAKQLREKAGPCQFYAKNKCTNGQRCTFSHSFQPGNKQVMQLLQASAEPCKFYARGRCTNGKWCTYAH